MIFAFARIVLRSLYCWSSEGAIALRFLLFFLRTFAFGTLLLFGFLLFRFRFFFLGGWRFFARLFILVVWWRFLALFSRGFFRRFLTRWIVFNRWRFSGFLLSYRWFGKFRLFSFRTRLVRFFVRTFNIGLALLALRFARPLLNGTRVIVIWKLLNKNRT